MDRHVRFNLKLLLMVALFIQGCQTSSSTTTDFSTTVVPAVDLNKAATLHAKLALEYMHLGNMQRAKDKLNHALKLAPHQPEVYSALGLYSEQVGELNEADKAFQKAIALRAKGSEYHQYADFLSRQRRDKEALKFYQLAIKDLAYDNVAVAYESAGLCALNAGEKALAQHHFEKALNHDRQRPQALLRLAHLKWDEKDANTAMRYFQQYEQYAHADKKELTWALEMAWALNDKDKIARYQTIVSNMK